MNNNNRFVDITHKKEMWDSEKGAWVPFDLWGANFIINQRKEYLALRIHRIDYENDLSGWQSVDSSYLYDKLKEDKTDAEKHSQFISFAGYQDFKEMIAQDRYEYISEGRNSEVMGSQESRRA